MSVCISAYQEPASMYPVLDPRRTAGPGPWQFGYAFHSDAVRIDVQRDSSLTSCKMKITLNSSLTSDKQIKAWNFFKNGPVNVIGTTSGLANTMTITKAQGPPSCITGTDTVVLCKRLMWNAMTEVYSFYSWDFWDFWGGCDVTFNWMLDNAGSGLWGAETPPPIYPLVAFPDRTLLSEPSSKFSVVFGGAAFAIPIAEIPLLGLDPSKAVPGPLGNKAPVDSTLVRELGTPEVYVVYGGAKFWIPDPTALFSLGFNWIQVQVIPKGGAQQLGTIPFDGTLTKEQHDPRVFLVINRMLSLVTSPARMDQLCLPVRHLRTVPDKALSNLPRGPNL
jgi:hypothetical protein